MTIQKRNQIIEGKSKILFETDHPKGLILQHFKDDATAFNGEKKGSVTDKGVMNNAFSSLIFEFLEKNGIQTHFVEKLSEREMLIEPVKILPIEIVVRNLAAGSLCKRLGVERGKVLTPPLLEYFYKSDPLGDPLISKEHILQFGWASETQLEEMKKTAFRLNTLLKEVFLGIGLNLVDYKLEFGTNPEGTVVLADEFTPDGCRLWDVNSGESMDKDRFRFDMGKVEESYREVYSRLSHYFKENS